MRRMAALLGLLAALLLGSLLTLAALIFLTLVHDAFRPWPGSDRSLDDPFFVAPLATLCWLGSTLAAAVGEELSRRMGGAPREIPPHAGFVRNIIALAVGVAAGLLAYWIGDLTIRGNLVILGPSLWLAAPTVGLLAARAVHRDGGQHPGRTGGPTAG